MEISPRHLSSKLAKPVRESKWDEIRNDIWIEIKFGEQTRLADISRETLREYEAKEIKGRRPRPDDYSDYRGMDHFRISGFTFWFDGDTLKGIEINRFHFPPGMKEARPRIGSISRGTSLSIPASVEEFEAVFGAADEVSRTYQSL